MIRIYHTNEGILATTGYWLFDNMKAAEPTIKSYELAKQEDPILFNYVIEEINEAETV